MGTLAIPSRAMTATKFPSGAADALKTFAAPSHFGRSLSESFDCKMLGVCSNTASRGGVSKLAVDLSAMACVTTSKDSGTNHAPQQWRYDNLCAA